MTSYLPLVISFLSFCVSGFTFYRGSPWEQNRRLKMEKMRLIAIQSVVIWDQMLTIAVAKSNTSHIDPYFFPSYQRNIGRLEKAINEAISIGLFNDLIGDKQNALSLHTAFVQSLAHMESLSIENIQLDDWMQQHFVMGMVRLLDCCISLHSYTLPMSLQAQLLQKIDALRDESWNYIESN